MNIALLIGINYKNTNFSLKGCINDTLLMKNLLLNCGYNNFIIMNDDLDQNDQLYPTYKNIITQFKKIVNSPKNSKLFIHYSGHGSQINDDNRDEDDLKDECICPVDFINNGFIIDDYIKEILIKPLDESIKLTCLFDCCHSGTILDLRYSYDGNFKINYDEIEYKSNVCLISGSKDEQTASDTFENNLNCGALTNAFINEFYNGNSYEDLYKRIINNMKLKYKQKPQLSFNKLINIKSQFII